MSKFMFHLKFSKTENYVNEHEVFEMMRSRDLYQLQFDLRLKLKKRVRALETEKRVQASTFHAKRAVFLQKMADKVTQRNKINSKKQKKTVDTNNILVNTQDSAQVSDNESEFDVDIKELEDPDSNEHKLNYQSENTSKDKDISENNETCKEVKKRMTKKPSKQEEELIHAVPDDTLLPERIKETRIISYDGKTFPVTRAWKTRPEYHSEATNRKTRHEHQSEANDSDRKICPENQSESNDGKIRPENQSGANGRKTKSGMLGAQDQRTIDREQESDSLARNTETVSNDNLESSYKFPKDKEFDCLAIESVAEVNSYDDKSNVKTKNNKESGSGKKEVGFQSHSIFPPLKQSVSLPSRGKRLQPRHHTEADKIRHRKRKTLCKGDKAMSLPEIPAPKPMIRIEVGGTTPDGKLILNEADYEEYLSKYRRAKNNRLEKVKRYSVILQNQVDSFESSIRTDGEQ